MSVVFEQPKREMNESFTNEEVTIVFVLGGPGSGKGTQCLKISQQYGFCHLSAGDLLRSEVKSGSDIGAVIQNMINEGKLVPSAVTVELLKKAMQESGKNRFLIDGFPRNEENRSEYEKVIGIDPEFVLYCCCSKEVMVSRLLERNQGREDDNIDTIRKRVELFYEESLPVIEYYASKGKLRKVDGERSIEEVFQQVTEIFTTHENGVERVFQV